MHGEKYELSATKCNAVWLTKKTFCERNCIENRGVVYYLKGDIDYAEAVFGCVG